MDKIIFIPAGIPPHKIEPKASSWDRYLMTNIATITNDKFIVSDIEIKKQEKSYTLNTIKELLDVHDNVDLYFITGTDAIIDLPNWHEYKLLLKLCKFIAVLRPGLDKVYAVNKIKELNNKYNGNIELLQVPMLQISSTDIRERISAGRSAKYLLPEMVEEYIIKNNLYGISI